MLIDSFRSAAELFDTARAVAVYRSSGHAISQPLIVFCCKRSCPGVPVCHKRRSQSFLWHSHSCAYRLIRYCTGHRSVRFLYQLFCCCCFFLNKNKTFWYNSGLISGFVGKSCCSETTIVTDFQGNMHTKVNWDSNPAYKGDRCSRD